MWCPPAEVDEYRLVRPLGSGAGGSVYLAQDTLLDRFVAVKFIPGGNPELMARFLAEARAAARIQHPNVATLYRVGRVGDRAYLVSEFIRGTSLGELPKPLEWRRALEIGIGLARGLAAAHRRGVLHRDIKPANVLLADDGVVKLVDFGVAQFLDASGPAGGIPVGTPYYMSPESWRGGRVTARADIYSLGAVLYELCAERGPHRDVPQAELVESIQARDVPPLGLAVPAIDRAFAAAIDRCLRRDPAQRFASVEELLDALEPREPAPGAEAVPEGNPYRGLQAFLPEHRSLFFGRRRDRTAALERLRTEAALLVTGDSGAGKSSLCLAGLLPAIADGALDGARNWSWVRLLPGRRPIRALAEALSDELEMEPEAVGQFARNDPGALARKLSRQLGKEAGLTLFVDQLEELITLSEPGEVPPFALAIAELASGFSCLRLLATVRSDFLARLAELPGLGELIPRTLLFLRGMEPEQAREAVLGPARMKRVRFESEELVASLCETHSGGAGLPLLQFALAELWEARDVEAGLITKGALERIGGVSGALARHADGVMERLLPEQRLAARRILLRLVTLEGTRTRRAAAELIGVEPQARKALEALIRGRLVVAAGESVEIAHEALARNWRTLSHWLTDEAEHRAQREHLAAAAAEWQRAGRHPDLLWGPRRLTDVEVLDDESLAETELAFLSAARRKARRERFARRGIALTFLVSIALVVGGMRLKGRLDLDAQVAAELARATAAAAEAHLRGAETERARREAFRLFDTRQRAQADRAWSRALDLSAAADRVYASAMQAFEQTLALDPRRATVRAAFAKLLLERAQRAESDHRPTERDELSQRLRLIDPDGSRWQAWNAPAVLTVQTDPPGADVELSRIEANAAGRRVPVRAGSLGPTPVAGAKLQRGAYLLTLRVAGRPEVRYPISLDRAEQRSIRVPMPAAAPAGFAYVPAGRSQFGTASGEAAREFFNTVPMHPVDVRAFFISRHETTFKQWIDFLRTLSGSEKERRTPHVVGGLDTRPNQLELIESRGVWHLLLQAGGGTNKLGPAEKVRYPGRSRRAVQDWLRLPVAGVSADDARAYARWLSTTGRVPGARLCTETEWERAARGADDREFPSGDRLAPDDANFDLTYGKQAGSFGPDQVGSHPGSRSAFGVDDLAGNVWEWVESSLAEGEVVARGGSYYAVMNTCSAANRETPEPAFRSAEVGVRICASAKQ
jgi:formylglycine-generating enzyme required for sulfatase activity